MRTAVLAGVLLLAVALAVTVAVGFGAFDGETTDSEPLEPIWVADTSTTLEGNHHQPAIVRVDDEPHLAVPLNGEGDDCRVVVLRADGSERWQHEVQPANCHGHAVGDVAAAQFPGDEPTGLVATGEEQVLALDARTGEVSFQHELQDFGYSPPIVIGDEPETLVVTDFLGTVTAVADDGTERWTHELGGYVWDRPVRAPGPNGSERIVVAGGTTGESGFVRALGADGTTEWTTDLQRPVHAVARTEIDGDPVVVGAGSDGAVRALRTDDGSSVWSRSFRGTTRARTADGTVYVTDDSGTVRRLDPETGSTEWSQSAGESDHTALPIGLADLSGPEPVPVVLDPSGRVSLLAPANGSTLATRDVDAELLAPPSTGDVTGDDRDEIVVVYGDGRTALLEYSPD